MATSRAVAALLCAIALHTVSVAVAQAPAATGFLGQLGAGAGGANASAPAARPAACNGTSPANVIIESVTPVPAAGKLAKIELRNIGGQAANITGWRLKGSAGNDSNASVAGGGDVLYIADAARCKPNGTIPSGQSLVFYPKSDTSPCGFPFTMGASGTVTLADYDDKPRSVMSWSDAQQGTQIHVPISGTTALRVPANGNVIDVLKSLGNYGTFLLALQSTGLDQQLTAASDPNYAGPVLPAQQYVLDLPWWFAGAGAASPAPPPPAAAAAPPSPPPVGVPAAGPYTILAPTDDAFDALLVNLGGANGKLPLDALLRQPTLKDILLYHIIPGQYTSSYLRNNTPIYTAKGVEVVPIVDGCQTEGKIEFHDSCIDKPTADNFTCAEQKAYGKCDFPFMTSALAAQWQGGFCQRTCLRCDCSPGSGVQCSIAQNVDLDASNGVIHGISRVLFPPPVFTKEQAIRDAIAYNESLSKNMSMGILPSPGMTGLNELPGAAPGAGLPAAPGANGTASAVPAAANATTPAASPAAATTATTPPAASPEPAAAAGPPPAASPEPAAAAGASPAPAAAATPSPAPGARRRRLRSTWL